MSTTNVMSMEELLQSDFDMDIVEIETQDNLGWIALNLGVFIWVS